ncbi:hypothetical protein OAB57_03275 [Bacteriovoracaceae bacterium]|nr:hypothetical protein [Bacteriovoracaceae bacterium]
MGKLQVMNIGIKCAVFFLFLPSVFATVDLRGYTLAQISISTPVLKTSDHQLSVIEFKNINRLHLLQVFKDESQLELEIELNQLYQIDHGPIKNYLSSGSYRIDDFSQSIVRSHSNLKKYYLLKELDRLSYSRSIGSLDVVIGRQQISFGSAKMINPTDIFTPFSVNEINKEERSGIDAVRMRGEMGSNAEIDTGLIIGEQFDRDESAAYLRLIVPYKNIEIKPIVAYYYQAWAAGIDVIIPIEGSILYFESLMTSPKKETSYTRISTGVEYQWTEDFYSTIEYHYNGSGEGNQNDYDLFSKRFSQTHGRSYLLNRHYIAFLGAYQISALHSAQLSILSSIQDHSALVSTSWEASLNADMVFSLGGYFGVGERSGSLTRPESEFGLYGKTIYSKLKCYF